MIPTPHTLAKAGIVVFERGWLSSNNVLVWGDEHHGAGLVDTGYWTHADQTVALVRQALEGRPLARIFNTHLHSDHCGGNAALKAAFDCPVDIPAGEVDTVSAWDEGALTYRATGQHCPRFRHDGALQAPSTVSIGRWTWHVMASPGHDPRAIALYQPDLKVLLTADSLWEHGFGVVFPELEGESAFGDVAATLDAFSRLDVRCVIPGHGSAFADMHAAIGRARRRLDSFVSNPRGHALHAAKVLIKFRLLETRRQAWDELLAWASAVPYFDILHVRYFADIHPTEWVSSIVADLRMRGALRVENQVVFDAE